MGQMLDYDIRPISTVHCLRLSNSH